MRVCGLAAMAAGHAERQKEESLAASAWPLRPVLWDGSARRGVGRPAHYSLYMHMYRQYDFASQLACTCVLRSCARGFF